MIPKPHDLGFCFQVDLLAMPQVAETPSCLPLGEIGVLINGSIFITIMQHGNILTQSVATEALPHIQH